MIASGGLACDTSATGDEGGSDEEVTIRVALWDYSNVDYYKTMFAAFEEDYPNIKIDPVEFAADEYPTVVTTQLAGKQDFDVVFHKTLADLSGLINQGHIKPVTDYIEETEDFNPDSYSGLLDALVVDGETYGLPYRKDNYLLYYNKDLFDQAGVDYPEDGMNLEEYGALAEKMTSGEGNDKVYGTHFHIWPGVITNMIRRTERYSPVDTSTFDNIEPLYDFVIDLQDRGIIQDFGTLQSGNIHYSGVFYNQQAAMIQIGTWFTNMLLENAEFNWGAVTLPNDDGVVNETGVGSITPASLGEYAKHPDEGWIALQYICGEAGALVLAETGILPAYTSDAINGIFDAMPETNDYAPENFSKYIDIPKYITEFPMDPNGATINNILDEQHSSIMTKSVSIREGLDGLIERVNDVQD